MVSGNLDQFSDLVGAMGSKTFANAYYDLFRTILDVEECTVFSFSEKARPQPVLIQARCQTRTEQARAVAMDYIDGGYQHDPNIVETGSPLAVYTAGLDRITDAGYRARFYDQPSIKHELVVLGRSGANLYYASFYRTGVADAFRHEDIARIDAMGHFILKALHRHHELCTLLSPGQDNSYSLPRSPSEQREETYRHLRQVLLNETTRLSPREAEVCAGIIMGYSTLAIGLNCNITPNTVATHRKRAYAKLGISSQNELFTRYFTTVRDFEAHLTPN